MNENIQLNVELDEKKKILRALGIKGYEDMIREAIIRNGRSDLSVEDILNKIPIRAFEDLESRLASFRREDTLTGLFQTKINALLTQAGDDVMTDNQKRAEAQLKKDRDQQSEMRALVGKARALGIDVKIRDLFPRADAPAKITIEELREMVQRAS